MRYGNLGRLDLVTITGGVVTGQAEPIEELVCVWNGRI